MLMAQILKSKHVRQITEIVVLVLMLWSAPVPVGHCHGDCGPRVSNEQMSLHLQFYHGGIDNAKNWPNGWHLHWVFPSNGQIEADCEMTNGHDDQMLADLPGDLFNTDVVSVLESWQIWRLCLRQSIPNDPHYSFQTVALLHCGQSLPELLGVMRC